MDHFLESIEFVTILLLFYVFVCFIMRDVSSLTMGQTCIPCIGRQSLNHKTTREVP